MNIIYNIYNYLFPRPQLENYDPEEPYEIPYINPKVYLNDFPLNPQNGDFVILISHGDLKINKYENNSWKCKMSV
jgi:hypothetical protein